jgi:hypothetical protein
VVVGSGPNGLAAAIDGNRIQQPEKPTQRRLIVVLASHHPDDQPWAGRLDQRRIEPTDVIAGENGRAGFRKLAR